MKWILVFLIGLMSHVLASAGEGIAKGEITGLVVAPDGKTLLVGSMDGQVRLIDLDKRKQRAEVQAHKGGVWDLALSADGKRFITGGADKIARVWNFAKVKEIRAHEGHKKGVSAVALSPDGKLAASGDYAGLVRVWETASGKVRRKMIGNKHRITSLTFSGDGKRLAAGGVEPLELTGIRGMTSAGKVRLWHLVSGDDETLAEHGERVAFLPGGNAIVTSGWDLDRKPAKSGALSGGARSVLWNLTRKQRQQKFEQSGLAMALSADGRYIATGLGSPRHAGWMIITKGGSCGIHLHESATGKSVWTTSDKEADDAILALATRWPER